MTENPYLLENVEDSSALHALGAFIVLWAVFECVLEIGIMKELNINAQKAAVITCDMHTKARADCLRALISLHTPNHKALSLIIKIQDEGKRNTIHHGLILVRPLPIKFVKRSAGGKYKQTITSFGSQEMQRHINKIANLIDELKAALSIRDEDMNKWFGDSAPPV